VLNSQEIAQAVAASTSTFSIGVPILLEMHDAGNRDVLGLSDEDFAVFAHMSAPYQGTPPEDPRVLNALVMDMVTEKMQTLEASLGQPLLNFLRKEYGDGDLSDFEEDGLKDFIWESQIDYVAMVDEDQKQVHFDIELTLVMESMSEEPEE
jgi:hypothetical protein